MYRESVTTVHQHHESRESALFKLVRAMFLLGYFVLLPMALMVAINWAVYSLTYNNFYQETWMMPVLLLLSTFLSGALMRQKMEDETGGLGLFFFGIVALMLFAWLTYQDVVSIGAIYSKFMPKLLRGSVLDYIYMLPGVGIVGMMAYKQFTLKHYN